MNKKKLFEYAVVFHNFEPAKEAAVNTAEVYKDSELIIMPTIMMAKDEKEVAFKVTRLIPEKFAENPDHVQIMIRNF
jgi:hypothetical protein